MFSKDLFELFLVFKDIEARYERTRARGIFLIVIVVVSFITCTLSISLLNHLFIKPPVEPSVKKFFLRQTNLACNIFQLGQTQKHLQAIKCWFLFDRSGKCFIFTNNLYIKRGQSLKIFLKSS